MIYFLFIILINKRTILACETFSSAKKYNVLEADSVSSNINKRDVGTSNIYICIKQNGKKCNVLRVYFEGEFKINNLQHQE